MLELFVLAGAPITLRFDLARLPKRAAECQATAANELLVCAPKIVRDRRVHDLGDADQPYLPKAEVNLIGDVKGTVENEAGDVGGFPSKRMMVRVKIPL